MNDSSETDSGQPGAGGPGTRRVDGLPRPEVTHLALLGYGFGRAWKSLGLIPLGVLAPPLAFYMLGASGIDVVGDFIDPLDEEPVFAAALAGWYFGLGPLAAGALAVSSQLGTRSVRKRKKKLLRKSELGPPEPAPPPSMKRLWVLGKALYPSALALFVMRFLAAMVAFMLLVGLPASFVNEFHDDGIQVVLGLLFSPLILMGLIYVAVLDSAIQLGLQSLAANRRGAGSAMQHAWRLMAASPGSTARCVAMHTALSIASILPFFVLYETIFSHEEAPATIGALAAAGFASLASVHFWRASYQRLGGIQTGRAGRVRGPLNVATS